MTRKVIRQAIVDALLNQTSAADRVHRSKTTPIDGDHAPAITVYVNRTSSGEVRGAHILQFKATHEIKVEAYVAAAQDWDDDLEDLIEQIETRLFGSAGFNIFDPSYGIEAITGYGVDITLNDGGEVPVACGIITINAQTNVCYNPADDPALPDLLRVHVDVDQAPADGTIDVSADYELDPVP